jgi:cytoskeleton protein RodZ
MEDRQNEQTNGEMETKTGEGFGAVLKAEREKRGLSHDQMAHITKLRTHVLDALEREEWDKLPALVFVKGFIRSYAKALDLDDESIADLYRKIGPTGEEPPKPLVAPGKSKKRLAYLVLIILLFGIVVISLLMGYPRWKPGTGTVATPPESQEGLSPKKESPPSGKGAPDSSEENSISLSDLEPPQTDRVDEPGNAVKVEAAPSGDGSEKPLPVPSATPAGPSPDAHVLKAFIKSRTWVRILIDGQEPKEYIFQPGSRPQWVAEQGFDILVGNAAGVEFEFNGEKIEDLGKLGQVVRLRLPEDFENRTVED